MPKPDGPHYLRSNADTKLPRRHIFLDTEARIEYGDNRQVQRWLCGAARFYNADTRLKAPKVHDAEYLTAEALWADVAKFTRSGARTILWAHNLAYDLRISGGFTHLPDLGFSLRAIVLDGLACWARFERDKRSLVCTDLSAWLAVPLSTVAADLDMGQEPLPDDPDDIRGWLKRCTQDVAILARAVTEILEWIEEDDLGNWQITGAAQAWSCYRHRYLKHKLLVHANPKVREDERRAIWAGRTECWRHGTYTRGPFYEFDLETAYAVIARDLGLPLQLVGTLPRVSLAHFDEWRKSRALLCRCVVQTDKPLVPGSHNDRIVWPVGRFRTVLWDHEITALRDSGAKVRLYRTAVYTRAPVLREWATWILDSLGPGGAGLSRMQRRILKHWSRALIGRFSLRYRTWEGMGEAADSALYLSRLTGKGEAKGAALMQVGRDLLELGALVDHENALPQITGYITAECRIRLWDLIQTAGEPNVYYMDTDSLIVNRAGADALRSRIAADGAYGLREKREIGRLELAGPRNLTVDSQPRIAGVPKRSERLPDDNYFGAVWEGLSEALAVGNADRVLVYERTFRLTATDHRRKWLDDGRTEPYSLGVPVSRPKG